MKQAITKVMLVLSLLLVPAAGLSMPAYADCGKASDAKTQVLNGIGETGGNCDTSGVQSAIAAAVQILSIIVGVAAVIVIILGGFKYITSGGDSAKVGNAKSTLIYAMIGLAVAALAQLLVHFVLYQADTATLPACPADHSVKPPQCK